MATEQDNLEVQELEDGSATIEDPNATEVAQDDDDPATDQDAEASQDAAQEGEGQPDAEREAIRARRRQERQDKKLAQREREDGLRSELTQERYARMQLEQVVNEMASRTAQLEQHRVAADVAGVDASLRRATDTANYWQQAIAEAVTRQDGNAVADATNRMIAAREEAGRLSQVKNQMQRPVARPQTSSPQLPREAAEKGMGWIKKNDWYQPNGGDRDSEEVRKIDSALTSMGYDPKTDEYWEELSEQVEKRLPHRATSTYTAATTARGKPASRTPVTGSGRENVSSAQGAGRTGTYTLSPARVEALKNAGMWSDPKLRADAIQHFRKYDQANKA